MVDSSPRTLRDPLVRALLGLTLVTGMVDALSFIALGSVFTANQTGNIVLLGLGIAGTGGLEVIAPLLSLAFFLAGATVGGAISVRLVDRHPRHVATVLGIEVALVAAAAAFAAIADVRANEATGDVVIGMLAVAMGIRTASCIRIGVQDLSTTVVTLPITGLMANSKLAGGTSEGTQRRLALIASILAGAVAGSLLFEISDALVLAVAASLSLSILLLYLRALKRERDRRPLAA